MAGDAMHLPIDTDVERIASVGPQRTQGGWPDALTVPQMELEPLDMASHHGRAPVGFNEYALFGVAAGVQASTFKRKWANFRCGRSHVNERSQSVGRQNSWHRQPLRRTMP
jgi:hypothetical protein